MRKYRIILILAILLSGLLPLVAQNKDNVQRTIIVGGDYDFPPYEFLDKDQNPAGYNVELIRAVAEAVGLKVEFRLGKWTDVKEWLESGHIDVIEGMAHSQERAKTIDFSMPHCETWRGFFVQNNSRFKSSSDLMSARIALQQGDIAADHLATLKFKGSKLYVPTQEDAMQLLADGKADAAVVTYMQGMYIIQNKNLTKLKVIDELFAPRFYCFAVKKPNNILINDLNAGLSIIKQSGKYKSIQDKWFGKYDLATVSREHYIRRVLYIVVPLFLILLSALLWVWFLRRQISRKTLIMRQELEDKLKYESELNREYKMFVNGPVIVYKLLSDFNIISYVSDNIRQFGYDPRDLILQHKLFPDLIFSEDKERVMRHFKDDIANGCEFSAKQYRIVTANGQICWVFDYTLIVREPDNATWFYGYILDITAQKSMEAELLEAKEKAETANIAKGHFLSNISHEIRTPLNGIIGFIQVLQNTDLTDEQKGFVSLIQLSGSSLMKIVNDILDFSKLESGKLDLIVTDFNPRYLIDDIVKTHVQSNSNPEVELQLRISDKLPATVYGDMMRLRQILKNLLLNAMKFTEKGYVEITADVYNSSDDDIRLLFSVRDTGIGLDPLKQRDIFDNFAQIDNNVIRKYGGTGLGLSIVKKLVDAMGGFIWVESEPGKGSNFLFIIPFRTKSQNSPRHELQLETAKPVQIALPSMNILLVEDEPINQVVTKKQLERWGQKVTVANNGLEAVNILSEHEYDCILMDIQMPEMDGITATNIIREKELGTSRHVPIIAFTAAAMSGDKERFLESGMDDYIAKPIDIERLYSILAHLKIYPD